MSQDSPNDTFFPLRVYRKTFQKYSYFKSSALGFQLVMLLALLAQCTHLKRKGGKLIKHARAECWRAPLPENSRVLKSKLK